MSVCECWTTIQVLAIFFSALAIGMSIAVLVLQR
jgi:hypothetical protein